MDKCSRASWLEAWRCSLQGWAAPGIWIGWEHSPTPLALSWHGYIEDIPWGYSLLRKHVISFLWSSHSIFNVHSLSVFQYRESKWCPSLCMACCDVLLWRLPPTQKPECFPSSTCEENRGCLPPTEHWQELDILHYLLCTFSLCIPRRWCGNCSCATSPVLGF